MKFAPSSWPVWFAYSWRWVTRGPVLANRWYDGYCREWSDKQA